MSAGERLKALGVWVDRGGDSGPYDVCEREQAETLLDVLPKIVTVIEMAERGAAVVAAIRALGFVGNAHYCPDCMNHFHGDRGQHEPGCSVLAGLLDEEWWDDRDRETELALAALTAALTVGGKE